MHVGVGPSAGAWGASRAASLRKQMLHLPVVFWLAGTSCPLSHSCWDFVWLDLVQILCIQSQKLSSCLNLDGCDWKTWFFYSHLLHLTLTLFLLPLLQWPLNLWKGACYRGLIEKWEVHNLLLSEFWPTVGLLLIANCYIIELSWWERRDAPVYWYKESHFEAVYYHVKLAK